jgi:hypothetical protein
MALKDHEAGAPLSLWKCKTANDVTGCDSVPYSDATPLWLRNVLGRCAAGRIPCLSVSAVRFALVRV